MGNRIAALGNDTAICDEMRESAIEMRSTLISDENVDEKKPAEHLLNGFLSYN